MPTELPEDRRTALKARHRRAILDATRKLIEERGAPRFSVDELAERADIARRTVFNHFVSIDDVVMTTCTDELSVLISTFQNAAIPRVGDGSRSAIFDAVAGAMRGADVLSAIAYIRRALGGFDEANPRHFQLVGVAFSQTERDLVTELARRYPESDRIEIEILVGSLLHGAAVIAWHWVAQTGAVVNDDTRRLWNSLLDKLIDNVRSGYGGST